MNLHFIPTNNHFTAGIPGILTVYRTLMCCVTTVNYGVRLRGSMQHSAEPEQ